MDLFPSIRPRLQDSLRGWDLNLRQTASETVGGASTTTPHWEIGTAPRCRPGPGWFWRPACTSWCAPYRYKKRVQPAGFAPASDPWQRSILLLDDGCMKGCPDKQGTPINSQARLRRIRAKPSPGLIRIEGFPGLCTRHPLASCLFVVGQRLHGCERTNTVATSIEVAPAGLFSRRIFRCFRHTSHEALEAGRCYTAGDVNRWGMGGGRGLQSGVSVDTPPVFEITSVRVNSNWTTPLPCFLWPIPPRSRLQPGAGSFFTKPQIII